MLPFRKKKKEAPTCGGTTWSRDENAPRVIVSRDMTFFHVSTRLNWTVPRDPREEERMLFCVTAYAAPADRGTFLFLEAASPEWLGRREFSWALVREDPFPVLAEFAAACDLAKENGLCSRTHGLPENFGGSIDVRYRSGERISVSDNRSPLLSQEDGRKTAEIFRRLMAGERVPLPDPAGLSEICFSEDRRDGGYTRCVCGIRPDGTAINRKRRCYSGEKAFDSEKSVDASTVASIREVLTKKGVPAWSGLPDNGFGSEKKSITLRYGTGEEITVLNDRLLPDQLRGGFFDIELELTAKH